MGHFLSGWRNLVGLTLAVALPVSLLADDTGAAMLHTTGSGVLVNNNPALSSTALFANDLIETPKNVAARIDATGSSTQISAETMVQFDGDELALDHGGLSVYTTRGLRVRVGCLTVTPVNPSVETRYEVVDVNGKVTVQAARNDVYVDARSKKPQDVKKSSRSEREIVHEGEQKSREEKCGAAYNKADRIPGVGAIMNSTYAKWIGAGIVGGLTCWVLCRSDDALSPAKP